MQLTFNRNVVQSIPFTLLLFLIELFELCGDFFLPPYEDRFIENMRAKYSVGNEPLHFFLFKLYDINYRISRYAFPILKYKTFQY